MKQISYELCANYISAAVAGESNGKTLYEVKRTMLAILRERLTPRQRQAVLLYFFERKSVTEIAEEWGVNKSTVSRTLARGLHNLREQLSRCRLR